MIRTTMGTIGGLGLGVVVGQSHADWSNALPSAANIVFSAVVAWYLLTKAIPKQQEESSKSAEKQQQSFKEALKDLQASFDRRDGERKSDHKEALTAVLSHCEREVALRDQRQKTESEMVNRTITNNIEVLEEVRDALRELKPKPA